MRFSQTMRSRPKAVSSDDADGPVSHPVSSLSFYTTMHGKPHRLFCELIMPLVHDSVYHRLPSKTSFVYTEEDILASMLSRIDKKCPQLYKDKFKFMQTVEKIVYGAGSRGDSLGSRGD
jgi:hypothetical protein